MTECHVQIVHIALIKIQTLNLRITSTRHYPVEPLTCLNCMKPHSLQLYWPIFLKWNQIKQVLFDDFCEISYGDFGEFLIIFVACESLHHVWL